MGTHTRTHTRRAARKHMDCPHTHAYRRMHAFMCVCVCVCVCVFAVTKDDSVCEDTDTQKHVDTPVPKGGLRAKFKSCYKTVKCEVKACAKTVKCEATACAKAVAYEMKAFANTVKCEVKACAKATQCGAKACAVEVKRCLGAWLRIVL